MERHDCCLGEAFHQKGFLQLQIRSSLRSKLLMRDRSFIKQEHRRLSKQKLVIGKTLLLTNFVYIEDREQSE